jgi:histone acetyltransferase
MSWIRRPPSLSNLRVHPGIRHPSRLWTDPCPFYRPADPFANVHLKYVINYDGAHAQQLIHLGGAISVITAHLPKMEPEYVLRLVFDYRAITVFLFYDGWVKGAISSRVFTEERFIEVVFLSVDWALQRGGKGRLLMNYLKTIMQFSEIFDFLVCADNKAIDFFQKQGFSYRTIAMDPKRWMGRIRDYLDVTLMHCQIYPEVDYFGFARALDKQMEFLETQTGDRYFGGVFRREDMWEPYRYCPQFLNRSLPELVLMLRTPEGPEDEPWKEDYFERMDQIKWRCVRILQQLQADEEFARIFERPVTEEIAPRYFDDVNRPMDFCTVRKRLRRFRDYYKRPEMFAADIDLIVENCKKYNSMDTVYHRAAVTLKQRFRELYAREFPEICVEK